MAIQVLAQLACALHAPALTVNSSAKTRSLRIVILVQLSCSCVTEFINFNNIIIKFCISHENKYGIIIIKNNR